MPRKILLLSAISLLSIHCKKEKASQHPMVRDSIQQPKTEVLNQKEDDHSQIETVKTFLKWYRDNEEKIYGFNSIKGGSQAEDKSPVNYHVDFNEVEKEMKFLKDSGLFSQNFLSTYRQRYVEGDEYFKQNPENDGPPHNFDYDYFFRTQDDYQSDLKNIDDISFILKPINAQKCQVEFHLKNSGMTYKYTLTKTDHWQIDVIEI